MSLLPGLLPGLLPSLLPSLLNRLRDLAAQAGGRCACCGHRQENAQGGTALCEACRRALAPPLAAPCPGCGTYPASAATAPDPAPTLCGQCRREPRPWGAVLSHRPYDGPLRELILAYKFQRRLEAGRALQECLLAAYERGLRTLPDLPPPDALVPVPLHPRRLLLRGFNQSREIARLVARRHGLPIEQGALRRIRRTVPQMELAREARAENIRGAFRAEAPLVEGKRLLLVDDIMTTGSTLEECARELLRAGAKRVDVLVLARA